MFGQSAGFVGGGAGEKFIAVIDRESELLKEIRGGGGNGFGVEIDFDVIVIWGSVLDDDSFCASVARHEVFQVVEQVRVGHLYSFFCPGCVGRRSAVVFDLSCVSVDGEGKFGVRIEFDEGFSEGDRGEERFSCFAASKGRGVIIKAVFAVEPMSSRFAEFDERGEVGDFCVTIFVTTNQRESSANPNGFGSDVLDIGNFRVEGVRVDVF